MLRCALSIVALACLIACGQQGGAASAGAAPAPATSPSDLTADQLLARYAAAAGGKERLLAIKTLHMTGKMTNFSDINDAPITIDKERAGGRYLRRLQTGGQTVIQAVDGHTVWEVDPGRDIAKPREMDNLHARRFHHRVSIEGPLVDPGGKGEQVLVVGKEKVDGADAYRIKVSFGDGLVSYYLIDAKSFRLVKAVDIVQAREPYEAETTYSDFRTVGGVAMPFHEQTVLPGLKQDIKWEKIEVDVPLPAAEFKMPA
jgi:hypothetical protein